MLAYANFRDIPRPLILNKVSECEARADLFAAFPVRDTLTFVASIDAAFLARAVFLRVRSDDDGSLSEIPLTQQDSLHGRHIYTAAIPLATLCGGRQDGLFFYHLVADTVYGRLYSHGADGRADAWFSDDEAYASPYQLLVYRDDYTTSSRLTRGVMYQILVDRFSRGGDAPPRPDVEMAKSWDAEITQYPAYPGAPLENNLFYGGDLDGVRSKLDYLASLGVSVIYLCPIFEAYSNHKYDTGDYMQVDPMFGGREALDRLLADARARGISVILDGVFNHTGSISRYFNKDGRYDSLGAYQSTESPYYSWYRFKNHPDDYESWWGIKILPSVRSDNPDYIRFIAGEGGVMDTYQRAGVSGFRLDVVDEISPDLVRAMRARLRANDPDAPLIGEVWEDASNKIAYSCRRHYFRGQELDSVMNYPLKNAILSYLLQRNAEDLASVTTTLYAHYPRMTSEALMNLLGTHDTERILTLLGGRSTWGMSYEEMKNMRLSQDERAQALSRLRIAAAILYTMPGIPCIYYGDEVGMEGGKDPFNRRTYPWGREDTDLLSYFRALGAYRKTCERILSHGYYRILHAREGELVITRESEAGSILLLANASDKHTFTYTVDAAYKSALDGTPADSHCTLPPLSFALLVKA